MYIYYYYTVIALLKCIFCVSAAGYKNTYIHSELKCSSFKIIENFHLTFAREIPVSDWLRKASPNLLQVHKIPRNIVIYI
jgi:hypothetical protein